MGAGYSILGRIIVLYTTSLALLGAKVKFLRRKPSVLVALEEISESCCPQSMLSLTVIPRYFTPENLYSKGEVIAWWLQSTSVQNSVSSCLKGSYFGQYFTSENTHREILSIISQAMYLLRQIFCGLGDNRFSARVMPKM